mmetsp:Transcript_8952/g.22822  ORF Transcript_8952/g.22822 Transcript_8952/m.22822 type:complete len:238 (-) Transcript_8952:230-943(-)
MGFSCYIHHMIHPCLSQVRQKRTALTQQFRVALLTSSRVVARTVHCANQRLDVVVGVGVGVGVVHATSWNAAYGVVDSTQPSGEESLEGVEVDTRRRRLASQQRSEKDIVVVRRRASIVVHTHECRRFDDVHDASLDDACFADDCIAVVDKPASRLRRVLCRWVQNDVLRLERRLFERRGHRADSEACKDRDVALVSARDGFQSTSQPKFDGKLVGMFALIVPRPFQRLFVHVDSDS